VTPQPGGADRRTLLVTVTGRDRPGVTAAVFGALADDPVEVLDLEQVVVRGRLVLGLLLTTGPDPADVVARVRSAVEPLGLDLEAAEGLGAPQEPPAAARAVVTMLGAPLCPTSVASVSRRLAELGGNIDRIRRLASTPVTAIELEVSGAALQPLRRSLSQVAADTGVDIGVEPAGLLRRAKRLVVMDVDSTLVQGEGIEMLAARAGVEAQVRDVTHRAMAGELDFEASLRARVALLAGLPVAVVDEVCADLQLTPGARTLVRTLKRLGYRLAIVSGGFTQATDTLAAELELDYSTANTLEVADGRLTGGLVGPVVDRASKAEALRRFAAEVGVPLSQTVAIGDGANDLDMIAAAGLGIAFNAKPVVRQAADTAVTMPFLDSILYLLGISRSEVEAADASDDRAVAAEPRPR